MICFCWLMVSNYRNSNAKCPKRPTQNDFGTAFVPTGQLEINCVAADVSPLHLKKRPQNNEPIHIGGYNF